MTTQDEDSLSESFGPHINTIERTSGKYGSLMDSIRRRAPEPMKCSLGCKGKNCKYCNPEKWASEDMAVRGLFSHWVTDDILATSRPIGEFMEKFSIIDQFKRFGIKSIINLQTAGEHSSCGPGLHESGFSYNPQEFMDNGIFFYNFGWDDYGVRSLQFLLDMAKVMAFAIKQGKVAVHCHAGMGRTGVLIACYLIYSQRMDGDNAVHYLRQKRPGSVQTSTQVEACQQFAQYLIPLRMIFSVNDPRASPFTLEQFLNRQKLMLHGYEARDLKYIPKIVYVIWKRLLSLAHNKDVKFDPKEDNYEIMYEMSPRAFQEIRDAKDNSSCSSQESLSQTQNSSSLLNDTGNSLYQTKDWFRDNSLQDTTHVSDSGVVRRPQIKKKMSILLSKDGKREESECEIAEGVARALAYNLLEQRSGMSPEQKAALVQLEQRVKSLQESLNASSSTWDLLVTEKDHLFLATLMWSWFAHLKVSILCEKDVLLLVNADHPAAALKELPKGTRHTTEFMLSTLSRFPEIPSKVEEAVVGRLAEVLSASVRDTNNTSNYRRRLRKCFVAVVNHKRTKRNSET